MAIILMRLVELLFFDYAHIINIGGETFADIVAVNATVPVVLNSTQCLAHSSTTKTATASRVAVKIFMQFFAELAVDTLSGVSEISQGIPIAHYWKEIGGLAIAEMWCFVNGGALCTMRLFIRY